MPLVSFDATLYPRLLMMAVNISTIHTDHSEKDMVPNKVLRRSNNFLSGQTTKNLSYYGMLW